MPGSLLTNRVVIDKRITVQSVNGAEVTRIRGAGPPGDNAVRCVWMTNGAALIGFTLADGATRTGGPESTEQFGGGLWAHGAPWSNAVIDRCVVTGNVATADGGGAYRGEFNQSRLLGNSADTGGAAYMSKLHNSLIAGNSAVSGGGTRGATLNNCTVTENTAQLIGGGVLQSRLNNCIVYYNSAAHSYNHSVSEPMNYTCTWPANLSQMPPSLGIITNEPLFVNAAAGDFRLRAGSPCIEAGTNEGVVGTADLVGNPRITGSQVDMGAYEYHQILADYDSDGDGQTDQAEYIGGSNPADE